MAPGSYTLPDTGGQSPEKGKDTPTVFWILVPREGVVEVG